MILPLAPLALAVSALALACGLSRPRFRAVFKLPTSPALGLILLLAAVPLRTWLGVRTGFADVTITEIAVLVAIAWTFFFRRPGRFFLPRQLVLWMAFILFCGLSLFWAGALGPYLKEMAKWAEVLVALVLACDLARNRRDLRVLLAGAAVVLAAELVLAAGLGAIGRGISPGAIPRLLGTFGQPNPFGSFMVMGLALALAAAAGSTGRSRLIGAALALAALLAILLSFSRGAWISAAAVTTIVLLGTGCRHQVAGWFKPSLVTGGLLALAGLALVGVLTLQLPPEPGAVVAGGARPRDVVAEPTANSYSVDQRIGFWLAAARMASANPLGGVGLGNFDEAYPAYFVSPWEESLGHAHNLALNIAAESGLIGLALFVAAAWASARPVWNRIREKNPDWIDIGVAAALAAFLIHGLVDYMLVGGLGIVLGIALGIALRRDCIGPA